MGTNQSFSSLTRDHLLAHNAIGDVFTATSICIAMGFAPPQGGVTAFLSHLLASGHLELAGREGRAFLYRYARSVEDVRTLAAPGAGSRPGQGRGGPQRRHRAPPSARDLAARLVELAAELERMEPPTPTQPDLATVPTDRLLAELLRRERAAARAAQASTSSEG